MNWLVGTYSKRNSDGIYIIHFDEEKEESRVISPEVSFKLILYIPLLFLFEYVPTSQFIVFSNFIYKKKIYCYSLIHK